TYKGCTFQPDNHVLLTTDEPSSDKPLCWVRSYENAKVCCIMSGHGPSIYADENYRKLLARSIRWCAAKPAKK
ncbi:MAG: ThuA domain-containing protein, partial [Planctomycetota bacterium]